MARPRSSYRAHRRSFEAWINRQQVPRRLRRTLAHYMVRWF